MPIKSSGITNGHSHSYDTTNGSGRTGLTNGHTHPVQRDSNGRATGIGPGGRDNHTHSL